MNHKTTKTLIDINADMLEIARKKFDDLESHIADLKDQLHDARGEKVQCKKQLKDLEIERSGLRREDRKRKDNNLRYKIRRICKAYGIKYDDDHSYEYDFHLNVPTKYTRWWVNQPTWLEGEDPLKDGHFCYELDDLLWLVEFYAKHHPTHPDHANRETIDHAPFG